MKIKNLLISLALGLTVSTSQAAFIHKSHVTAELIPEVQSIQPGQPFWVLLRLHPESGWHTYWKNPGESGLATQIKWTLPRGFQAGPFQWPYPEKLTIPPVTSYAFSDDVLLLTQIQTPATLKPGSTAVLKGKADWLECSNICVPDKADLSLTLPVKNGPPALNATELFAEARLHLPLENSGWTVKASQAGGKIILTGTAPSWFQGTISGVSFFPENSNLINDSAPQIFSSTKNGFTLELTGSSLSGPKPTSVTGVLVSDSGWRGAGSEKAIEVNTPLQAGGAMPESRSLLVAIVFAFLGGLILNLMPCVFPVLSLKVLGFIEQSHGDRGESFKHGLIFTGGVLVSFWTLAVALISLRAGGQQLGWGFQLQSPRFVIALSILFFMLGLNFFGAFEIGTPLTRAGGILRGREGWLGSFLSGVLATVVATPCTAPFMGSALGVALTLPPAGALSIFTLLGLGMASPYLVLSAAPSLLSFLPRPGGWMQTVKKIMGVFMMMTVAWLLWVLNNQTSWARQLLPGAAISSSTSEKTWEPYTLERVAELHKAGKPVFVDFSASWCLTCQVNERIALDQSEVQKKFKDLGIVLLKGDWTSQDEKITEALQSYGRSGVPCYVLYGRDPNAPPTVLPEILTPGIVLNALEKI